MKWVAAFAVCALGWACDASPTSPPPPPPPPPTRLIVTGSRDPLLVGMSRTFSVQAVFDGTPRDVSGTWSSSDQNVALVNVSGEVTARSNGTVRITVAFQGLTEAVELRAAPNYAGHWVGTFMVTSCGREGAFPVVTFCSSAVAAAAQPIQLEFSQTGLTVSGTLSCSSMSGPVQAAVELDGTLSLEGNITASSGRTTFTVAIRGWRSEIRKDSADPAGPDRMDGRFTMIWSIAGSPGNGNLEVEMTGLVR